MSEAYEGARRDPFSLTASVEDYVPSAAVETAVAETVQSLSEGRVPVVSGPTGLGKSLVLQLVGRALRSRAHPLYVPYCSLAPGELATLILGLLEWSPTVDPETALLEAARHVGEDGQRLLLLVDDASALPGDSAAALAHWCNASDGALWVAMAGLPGPSLRHARDAFGDRAEEIFLAEGLRSDEVRSYVDGRLQAAGAEPSIQAAFDLSALRELERVSGGNPRSLNLAAQAIMRNAYGARLSKAQPVPPSLRDAATGEPKPQTPVWEPPTSVGEYRFVRGRFIDPKTGDALPAPQPERAWREPLREDRPRRPATAPPVATPRAQPRPSLDPDDDLELETDLFGTEAGSDLFRSPDAGAEAQAGLDDGLGTELHGQGATAEPRLEVSPGMEGPTAEADVARRSRRGPSPLRWAALAVVLAAFGVGVWSQLERRTPTARSVVPEPVRPAQEEAPASPDTTLGMPGLPEALRRTDPVAEIAREAEAAAEAETVAEATAEAETVAEAEAGAIQEPSVPAETIVEAEPPAAPEAEAPETQARAAAPTPPAEVAVPAEMVSVAINATPWAVIEIDGKEVGETPLAGIRLEVGRHRFRARMPDGSVRERVERIDTDTTTVVFE